MKRDTIAAAAAALLLGLWGGYLMANVGGAAGPPLAAIGQSSGDIRPVNAPRQAPTALDGMALARVRIDTTTEQAKACLEFTADLSGAPEVRFADFVDIEPRVPAQLEANGKLLCITGLPYEPDRTVTVKRGLPAANGDTTDQDETFTLSFGQRPAYVGFVGSGMILPRAEADGLGIETVNVAKLKVEVRRIPDRILSQQGLDLSGLVEEGSWDIYSLNEAGSDLGSTVYTGELDIALQGPEGERRNQAITTVFPLGAVLRQQRPGAFVVLVRDNSPGAGNAGGGQDPRPAGSYRLILNTDLALQSFSGASGMDVVVRALDTARPQSGVTVTLVGQNNEELSRARSDGQGRVSFQKALFEGTGGARARFLMAYANDGDFTALDLDRAPLDLSRNSVDGRATPPGGIDAYLWTERGVYRPGELVRVQGLIRTPTGVAVMDRPSNLVVYRPNGTEYRRMRLDPAVMAGAVAHTLPIDRTAPRGAWRAELTVDGQDTPAGTVSFTVEDFVPQRLKVETDRAAIAAPLAPGQTRAVRLNAQFLYGAPGSGLAVESEGRLQVDPQPFDDRALTGFQFGKADESFNEQRLTLPATTTDAAGNADIAVALGEVPTTSLPLRLRVASTVMDPGGRTVREGFDLPVRLSPRYIGLKRGVAGGRVGEGQPAVIEVVVVDPTGRRVAAGDLSWTLVEEDWGYDWYLDGGQWKWRRTGRDIPRDAGTIGVGAAEPARWEKPGLRNGSYRLMLRGADGVEASIRFGVGWGGPGDDDTTPDTVEVIGPTEPVRAGGTARVTIRAPYPGRAQVVVATDRVLSLQTVDVDADGTTVSLRTGESWGAGAYVLVTVMTPRDPVNRPVPRRAAGVSYVPLDMGPRTLEVAVGEGMPQIRPRTRIEVPVKVTNVPRGERVRFSLALVDEGILQLTKFDSPSPTDHYFSRRALGVSIHDDYGRLLNPNLAAASVPRQGGDGLGGEGLTVVPTRTVALISDVLTLDARGQGVVPVDVPDFNGSLRLMLVAWTETALGQDAELVQVRDPVVADLTLPRFLAPGDQALATLLLDNIEGPNGTYTVSFNASGGPNLTLAPQRLTLNRGVRQTLRAPIAAGPAGIGRASFVLEGPEGFRVERGYDIQTRAPFLPVTTAQTARLEPGQSFTLNASLLDQLAVGEGEAVVSFSNTPGIDPGPLLASLERYPYGCTEQLVSVAMPLLYAPALADSQGSPLSPDERGRYRARVQEAINRILDRQGADGALGLWRADDRAATPWIGAYATDFLRRAKAAGYAVPDQPLARAYDALRGVARVDDFSAPSYDSDVIPWPGNPDSTALLRSRSAAYALYVLAMAGEVDIGRVRYFHDSRLRAEPSPLARAQIGAALQHLGDVSRASNAFRLAEEATGFRNAGDWYQSPVRDLAGVLALAVESGQTQLAERLAARLAQDQPDPTALMTQEQAQMLLAGQALARRAGPVQVALGQVAGAGTRAGRFDQARIGAGQVFRNDGQGPIWRTVTVSGPPRQIPPPTADGFSVDKTLFRLDGSVANPAAVRQGDRLIVLITGQPQAARTHPTVVIDLLPAGFEIEGVLDPSDGVSQPDWDGTTRTGQFGFVGTLSQPRVAEARDDRFVGAADVTGTAVRLAYMVRAVTPGSFVFPGAVVEDMYRPSFVGRSVAGRVEIAPQAP